MAATSFPIRAAFRAAVCHCLADPGEDDRASAFECLDDAPPLVEDGRIAALAPARLGHDDLRRLAEQGGTAAFCPSSTLFPGNGLFDLRDMSAAGVPVGLATDGGAGTSLSPGFRRRACWCLA